MHNGGDEEEYRRVDHEGKVASAIHAMVQSHGDVWRDGDTIVVFKITDVDAKNEDFWENMMKEMRK